MFNERIALAIPSLAGYDLFAALEKTRGLGFQSVMASPGGPRTEHSLGQFPTLDFYEATEGYKEKVKAALTEFKHISIHQAWDNNWKVWIDCASYFGAKIVTVHPSLRGLDGSLEKFFGERAKYLRQIGDYAQEKGILVGVENEGGKYDDYVRLIETIKHPSVGATIDVGHCAYFEEIRIIPDSHEKVKAINKSILGLINTISTKVFHFHMHNVRENDWRDHRSAPDGVIDFPRLFAEIGKTGYAGLFDIELEEPEKEKKASETGRYLSSLCQDILT